MKALYSVATSSRLVGQYREPLNSLGGMFKVTLLWVSGHRNVEEYEQSDGLTRRRFVLGSPSAGIVWVPLTTVKSGIYSLFSSPWLQTAKCNHLQQVKKHLAYNNIWSQEFLGDMGANAYKIIAVSTRHWLLGDNAARLSTPYNSHSRSCREEGELPRHFVCDCPV